MFWDLTPFIEQYPNLSKMGDPKMLDLFNWGIEGETYEIADGKVTQTKEQLSIYTEKYNLIRQITPFYAFSNLDSSGLTPLAQHINDLIGSNAKYAVFDPTLPFISETETEMGGTKVAEEFTAQYQEFN